MFHGSNMLCKCDNVLKLSIVKVGSNLGVVSYKRLKTNKFMKMSISSVPSSEMDDPLELTQTENMEETNVAGTEALPQKSCDRYLVAYDSFLLWKNKRKIKSFSENVFMAYFTDLSTKYKASTLWSTFSMLKSTMETKHDIDIKSYSKLY